VDSWSETHRYASAASHLIFVDGNPFARIPFDKEFSLMNAAPNSTSGRVEGLKPAEYSFIGTPLVATA
jgi:hypothetical protein